MEEEQFGPMGPQLYVLSERHYVELRQSEAMLDQLAHAIYNDTHRAQGDQRIVLPRAQMNYLFAGVSALIRRALDGVSQENRVVPMNKVRR
jgi:hypothetical protein